MHMLEISMAVPIQIGRKSAKLTLVTDASVSRGILPADNQLKHHFKGSHYTSCNRGEDMLTANISMLENSKV